MADQRTTEMKGISGRETCWLERTPSDSSPVQRAPCQPQKTTRYAPMFRCEEALHKAESETRVERQRSALPSRPCPPGPFLSLTHGRGRRQQEGSLLAG